MDSLLKIRLSLMMFLQFFIAGAFTPILSLYLKEYLHFSGTQTGIILSVTAIGAFVAPLATSTIADRIIRAEYLFALLNLAGGIFMYLFSLQKEFVPVIIFFLGYTIVTAPTFALATAIVFHHTPPEDRHKFGAIRVWGTIGWIVVAWVFSYLWLNGEGADLAIKRLPDGLKLAALTSFALGVYTFTLPSMRIAERNSGGFLPKESLRLLKNPAILRLFVFVLIVSIVYRFYFFGTAPFLHAIGFADKNIMPAMSLGQIPEVFAMGLLGWLLTRFGFKKILLIGLALDLFRYVALCIGNPEWLVITGLCMHGLAYTFIFTSASIYLDKFCTAKSRTGAHQFMGLITSGIGSLTGNLFCGIAMDSCQSDTAIVNYHLFWSIPSGIVMMVLLSLLACTRGRLKTEGARISQIDQEF